MKKQFVMSLLAGALTVPGYWLVEPEKIVTLSKVTVMKQRQGDSITIDIPVAEYVESLTNFTLRTEVRTFDGILVKRTDVVEYVPGMSYKFVTYSQLPVGRYDARVRVGYRLNPLKSGELVSPLAIIYVEDQ